MDTQTKELVAIGASVAGHCQPCLSYHVSKARELGISDDLIRSAIATGQMVEKGAVAAMRQFAATVLDASAQSGAACCPGGWQNAGKSCCA